MGAAEHFVSVEDISHHLGVAPITVYRWLERGKIPAHKIGRQWRFLVSEVTEWVKRGDANENSRDSIQVTRDIGI